MRERTDRLDQLAFGQRVFGSAAAADMPDVLVALRALPRYRMLMLTLDRMGIRTPALYTAAVRRAVSLSALEPTRAFSATAQFQGALALLSRMVMARTISHERAEALVSRLVASPLADGGYRGAVVQWLADDLRPAISRADTMEAAIIAALSGPAVAPATPLIQWEGQAYRFDVATAERRRLERVHEKQGGPPIDLALDINAAARTLASPSLTLVQLQATTARLRSMASSYAGELIRAEAASESLPAGVDAPAKVGDGLGRAVDELMKSDAARDLRRAARVAAPLLELSDEAAAQTLASLVYAADIGDPGGSALLAGDVSRRHDFGFHIEKDEERRVRTPWSLPRRDLTPGQPWHVVGSLLGLDVALAQLSLLRMNTDRVPAAPTLVSSAREALAQSVALMNPFALDNAGRDAIAEAIARGERRVAALRAEPRGLDLVADDIAMNGGRRQATAWVLTHEPDRVESMFSLGELVRLGDPGHEIALDPWGMAALTSSGCLCTEMPLLGQSLAVGGRPQLGLMAISLADLNLHVARTLKALGLPAGLTKFVLAAAMQDFIDEVRPTDADDWLTLSRAARLVSRERIEDYVAAVTANGPLVPVPAGAVR